MPRVKERSNLAHEIQEQRYAKALNGLEDGTYKTLGEAAVSNQLSKSSLGHWRNGWRSRQEAHQDEQIFSPAAEKAIVKWILKLDDYGFFPRVDILMGLVKNLAKEEAARQVPVRNFAVGKKTRTIEPYWKELGHPLLEPSYEPRCKVCKSNRLSTCPCRRPPCNQHPLYKACQNYLQQTVFSSCNHQY